MLIADAGLDLRDMSSRDRVQEVFGKPVKTESVDGNLVEHYRTRRKLSERDRATVLCMLSGVSFLTLETAFFPYELYLLGRRTLLGQGFQVRYDAGEKVDSIFVEPNGDFFIGSEGLLYHPAETESDAANRPCE